MSKLSARVCRFLLSPAMVICNIIYASNTVTGDVQAFVLDSALCMLHQLSFSSPVVLGPL